MKEYPRPSGHTSDLFGGPTEPWITREAVEFLRKYLTKEMNVVEFGSGSSTRWIAERVKRLVSIENDKQWYEEVKKDISDLTNVHYILVEVDEYSTDDEKKKYTNILNTYGAPLSSSREFFDLILVEGRLRSKTIIATSEKVINGGILMLDNAERYHNAQGIPWYGPGIDHMRSLKWKETTTSNGIIQTMWWQRT